MSSDRQLRCAIRAPVRYGDSGTESPTSAILMPMHLARKQSASIDATDLVPKIPNSSFRRVKILRKPEVIEFDPTLPPVDFPTLPEPWPKRRKISQSRPEAGQYSLAVDWSMSNGESNSIYTSNMAGMGAMLGERKAFDVTDNLSISDSDDEPIDDQEALGRKILNPTWSDLNPAIQLQIVSGLLKHYNWENACIKLDLNKEDQNKLSHYQITRDQQISREDRALATMREKQLAHLMNMDQSVLKQSPVPHQLVLNRLTKISRDFHESLTKVAKPELEFCRADDILAARQFLRNHHLNENLAGQWGSAFVELTDMPRTENHSLPERFQWKEDWTIPAYSFINPHGLIQDCAPGLSSDDFPSSAGNMRFTNGCYDTINPRDTFQGDRHPYSYWTEHTPFYLRDEFQDARMKVREHIRREMSSPLVGSEFTRIQVGPRQEARLSLGSRERKLNSSRDLSSKRRVSLAGAREIQKAHFHQPHVPLPGQDDETPSKPPKKAPKPFQMCDEPVTRSLGGCWYFNDAHPSVSQSRYKRQIEEARLEAEQKKMRNLAWLMEYETSGTYGSSSPALDFSDEESYSGSQDDLSTKFMQDLPGLDETFFGTYPLIETDWMMPYLPSDYFPNDTLFNPYVEQDHMMPRGDVAIGENDKNDNLYNEKHVSTMWQGPMNF